MSLFTPPQTPAPLGPRGRQTNTLGVLSLICSITGTVSAFGGLCCLPLGILGVLAIVGVVLGAIGVRHEPKGTALAGIIVGSVGTIGLVIVVIVMSAAVGFGFMAVKQIAETATTINEAEVLIEGALDDAGNVPSDEEGAELISTYVDAWGRPLEYRRIAADEFEIVSAGMDGIIDTEDDLTSAEADDWPPGGP